MDQIVPDRRPRPPGSHPSPAAHGGRPSWRPSWLGGALLTAMLLGLIALSIRSVSGDLTFVLLGSVGLVVGAFHYLFPGSQFFTLALTNFIGVYACIFVFFLESNFHTITPMLQGVAFVLPLAAFLGGAWWRADDIRRIVMSRRLRDGGHFDRIFLWMAPVWGIGALTFLVPGHDIAPDTLSAIFLVSMSAIAGVVAFVARDIAIFLLDAGLLFEGFFQQAARLVLPAFAFLTFYSLSIIMFGAIYTIMDRFMVEPNFVIEGVRRDLTFSEGLYFSIVTFATVGYGDIHPVSGAVRLVCGVEIVMGVLLMLFGFSAIVGHAKPTDHRDRNDPL
ncbi:potassium channel protein [Azospirillum cavernae]|uniref:Potassium channel protein n=1 Tax=Azospirillum cavernae TaxID=2320860 RepID=A0A418W015_9PROT|nr:potassium channel family protein [Azospirillum cavernae]RJF83343.1 potassium channel protein [Azospirillum cavernae]